MTERKKSRLDKALEYLQEKHNAEWCNEYGESGHTQPEKGIIFANWNDVPKGLQTWLEKCGYELEWSDEWHIDYNRNKAWRTSPNGYDWEPSTMITDGGEMLTPDDPPADWIAEVETDDRCRQPGILPSWIAPADLEAEGWTLFKPGLESGWFPGQDDTPEPIMMEAFKQGFEKVVFRKTEQSQFYSKWEAWAYKEADDEDNADTDAP